MPNAHFKQVAQPYTQNSSGTHVVAYNVNGVASTVHTIDTSTTAVTIQFLQEGNYTLNPTEDITYEIALSTTGNPTDTVTVGAATANSPSLTDNTVYNLYFGAGTKMSVRSGVSGKLSLVPSVQ